MSGNGVHLKQREKKVEESSTIERAEQPSMQGAECPEWSSTDALAFVTQMYCMYSFYCYVVVSQLISYDNRNCAMRVETP
jgi:hypothetical protein